MLYDKAPQPQPQPIDFYKDESQPPNSMLIEHPSSTVLNHHHHHQPMILGDNSSGGDDDNPKAPKRRAETWVQEETRALINFRRETDSLFNTSKSNKHLWDQISAKMREKGFDRSPTMCTDKWRNLLKEFKKSKHQSNAKMCCYKEIDDIIRNRSHKSAPDFFKSDSPKVDSFMQFSDKGEYIIFVFIRWCVFICIYVYVCVFCNVLDLLYLGWFLILLLFCYVVWYNDRCSVLILVLSCTAKDSI